MDSIAQVQVVQEIKRQVEWRRGSKNGCMDDGWMNEWIDEQTER